MEKVEFSKFGEVTLKCRTANNQGHCLCVRRNSAVIRGSNDEPGLGEFE